MSTIDPRPIVCLVVDDEPLAAALISSYVKRTPFLTLAGEVHSAEDALEAISKNGVELVFLDIHLPRLSGTQLAQLLPENVKVVFTTAYSDHALEGFKLDAVHYLLKPISYDEFLHAAIRAQKLLRTVPEKTEHIIKTDSFITVKSEYRLIRIPVSDIDYIEGLKDYVKIYLSDNPKAVLSLMSIKSLEDMLPEDSFMRVHRSFIVNMAKVRVIERNCIIMDERAIPVSDSYRKSFMERIESGM